MRGTAYIQAFTLYVDFSGYVQGVYFDDLNLQVLVKCHDDSVLEIALNALKLLEAKSITPAQAVAMVNQAAKSGGGQ